MHKKNNEIGKKATIIVHSGDFDKIMSALIVGNGYLSMGLSVTLFFTFWGLNALTEKGFQRAPLSKMISLAFSTPSFALIPGV